MPSKLQRHLDLIAYLVGRRVPVPVEELMEKIDGYADGWRADDETRKASARRMFERDKDDLRAAGIPLRTVKYSINYGGEEIEGYEITRRDFYLPYLKLVSGSPSESPPYPERHRPAKIEISFQDAPLALDALRRVADIPNFPLVKEARSAFRKLAFDLEPDVFSRSTPVLFLERAGAGELQDRLRLLSDALMARRRARFQYHGLYRAEETERDVAGYGLLFQNSNWYLVGHDALRAAVRIFRVDRMRDLVVSTGKRPEYEIPGDFTLKDYVGKQAWELGGEDEQPVMALVRFRFPQSVWAERNDFGDLVETEPDGAALRRFEVHQVDPFVRWVLGLEGDARIVEPAELVAELRAMAQSIARAHADGDHVGP